MRRSAVAIFLLMSVGLAAQTPLVVEHGVFGVHLLERRIGTEEYSVIDDGTHMELSVTTQTSDRGTPHRTSTKLDYLPRFGPLRLEQHNALSAQGGSVAADTSCVTEMAGVRVAVREAGVSRSLVRPAAAFPGCATMPAAVQMLMMRYWLHHQRPARLAMLRASADAPPVEIRAVGHDAFTVHGEVVRLTRYTVANLVFGREVLWMNDSERVAAIMTFAGGLPQEDILDEYSSAFDALFQSGVRQEMLSLAALTAAVRPIASGNFAIVGAKLIDTRLQGGGAAVENSVVIVRNNRIAAVGPASAVRVPPGMRVIRAAGQALLPGLWEMHSHYSGVEFGPALLAAGITTARDCGGEFQFLLAVRQAIEQRHELGPRLLLAGLVDGTGPDAFGLFTAGTPEQAKDVVDMYADARFDQIKVYTQIQPEVLRAIAAEAHRRGLSVTGHVPAAVDAFEGVADGMDQINHLQFVTRSMVAKGSSAPFRVQALGSPRARALIDLLAARQIVVDPTIGWGEMAAHPASIATSSFEPGVKAAPFALGWRYEHIAIAGMDEERFHERMVANLAAVKALFDAGVPIVAGSDTNLIGYGLDRELELYVEAGMTPLQAIQSATIVPARAMHRDGDSGTVEVGKRADLVLVAGDPLTQIGALRQVTTVITDGRAYSSRALGQAVGFRR